MKKIKTEITYDNRTFLVKVCPYGYDKVLIELNLVIRPHRKWLGRYESFSYETVFKPKAFCYSIPIMTQRALKDYTKKLDHEENISKMWKKGLDN